MVLHCKDFYLYNKNIIILCEIMVIQFQEIKIEIMVVQSVSW
jgi:hypothetical protein